jgi:serine/threonine-protein kinase
MRNARRHIAAVSEGIASSVEENTRVRNPSVDPTEKLSNRRVSGRLLDALSWVSSLFRQPAPPGAWSGVPQGDPAVGPQKYVVEDRLGEGGMGDVFLVYDVDLRRRVALKTLRGNQPVELETSFLQEAQVMAQLSHPNIVSVHEMGVTEVGRPYYTMPLVRGQTLREILDGLRAEDPGLSEVYSLTRRMQLFLQLTMAVEYAHSRGVLHRDIKPANVMVGEHGEVLILDWGAAKLFGGGKEMERITAGAPAERQTIGTPAYMAPEQWNEGDSDIRTDVFALGILLYELLTLEHPFPRGRGAAEALAVSMPRPRAAGRHVPRELEAACSRALHENPAQRQRSARELHDTVQAWLEATSDREKRRLHAGKLAARAKERLAVYRGLETRIVSLEKDASELRRKFKGWQTVEEKSTLYQAEDRVADAERELIETASRLVMTLSEALSQDESHPLVREVSADYYWDRFVEAENRRDLKSSAYYRDLVAAFDEGKYARRLKGDGSLTLFSDPPGAEVSLYRFVEEKLRLVPADPRVLGTTPLHEVTLPMGTYLIVLALGSRSVSYPVLISRNKDWSGTVNLYPYERIGTGFRFVPGGSFIQGGDEETRGWCLPRSETTVEDFSPSIRSRSPSTSIS